MTRKTPTPPPPPPPAPPPVAVICPCGLSHTPEACEPTAIARIHEREPEVLLLYRRLYELRTARLAEANDWLEQPDAEVPESDRRSLAAMTMRPVLKLDRALAKGSRDHAQERGLRIEQLRELVTSLEGLRPDALKALVAWLKKDTPQTVRRACEALHSLAGQRPDGRSPRPVTPVHLKKLKEQSPRVPGSSGTLKRTATRMIAAWNKQENPAWDKKLPPPDPR